MPIYEYICIKCSEKFSLLQSMNSTVNDTECPGCGSREVKKIISSFCCSSGPGNSISSSIPSSGFSGGG
ncbi:MAG: zinc ribbon domain-containing protein [Nitrospirota bacterium]